MNERVHPPPLAAEGPVREVPSALPPPLRHDTHPGVLRGVLHACYGFFWLVALVLGSPWLFWRVWRRPGFGAMVAERCGRGWSQVPPATRQRILVHGVSVGEIKGAQPIVRGLEQAYPDLELVISATTETGVGLARKLFENNLVVRFPADPAFLVRRFLRRVQPSFVVLIELEIWPNFLRECNRSQVPVAVVNGRITGQSHAQYHIFRRLLPQFDRISLFCAQSGEYAERFLRLGVDPARVLITGNIKADGLHVGAVAPTDELLRLLGAHDGRPCLVAGSTHEPEELALVRAWRDGVPEARLVLVPRHPPRCAEVVALVREELGVTPQLLTRLRDGRESPDPDRPAVVDTIGELEGVYALADLVFIGGSLVPHGGQNMLEPAAQGKPVVYGPHVDNFLQEAGLLEAAGASQQVQGEEELVALFRELLADAPRRAAMGHAGRAVVERQKGATRLTLAALARLDLDQLAQRAGRG